VKEKIMLPELIKYARDKQLTAEPGFAAKSVYWLVPITQDGRFLQPVNVSENKRPRLYDCCPDLLKGEIDGKAIKEAIGAEIGVNFLYEAWNYIALALPTDETGAVPDSKKAEAERIRKKHEAFVRMIDKAAREVSSLVPVAAALKDAEQIDALHTMLRAEKAGPGQNLSFAIDGKAFLKSTEWHHWWRNFLRETFGRGKEPQADSPRMVCLAEGVPIVPALTHPKVTKLGVGANTAGANLISYDKGAFESFGLTQGENGALSEKATTAYRAALDSLLLNGRLLGQMKIAFWYDCAVPDEMDVIDDLFGPSGGAGEEAAALKRADNLLTALKSGNPPPDLKRGRYFALSLTGAAGRVMTRDWMTGSLEQLGEAIETWFADLAITNVNGTRNANPPRLSRVLDCVLPPVRSGQNRDDYLKPIRMLQSPLWRAALNPNVLIPQAAITRLIESHKAFIMSGDFEAAIPKGGRAGEGQGIALNLIYTRMALIKAYFNRRTRQENKGGTLLQPNLNPEHEEPAYHCGRLMCLLAAIQTKALGDDINAGVVQRYYGAASATPGIVLGRLTRLSQHHIAKIKSDPKTKGLGFWLEGSIADVWNALGSELPRTLTAEQQALFALGYYQQMAFNRTKKSGNPEANETPEAAITGTTDEEKNAQ
jgi:CRISPR-associated protein Csd1